MIQNVDFAILDWIQKNLRCGFLDFMMAKVTILGEHGIFPLMIAVVLLIFQRYRRCGFTILCGMSGGYLIGNIILKNVVARPRPCWINDAVNMLVAVPKDYSFPSGHTLHLFIFATVLMFFDKRIGIPALILASLVGLSRIYLYVHFPTDVLAGAALGIGIGVASFLISEKISKIWKERAKMNVA